VRKLPIYFLGVIALALAQGARADVISVGALKDNTLYEESSGALSNGMGEYLFAGKTAGELARRAVIAFDIAAAVPTGATINSASLRLNMSRCGPTCSTTVPMGLYRLLGDWGEGASDAFGEEGGGGASQPGDATWIHTYYDTDYWVNEGGDFSPLASAIWNVTNLGVYTWSTAQLASDVQGWLDNPAESFGWILIGGEGPGGATAKQFGSKDNLVASERPVLTIDYTPIPEPSTVFFVAAGMIAVLRFRRR
jgi:hypothetical protein